MTRRCACLLTPLFLLTFGSLNVFAQQFAAGLIHLKPEGAAPSKVFVSGDRIRFETIGPQKVSVVVVDLKKKTGFMALPDDKTYSLLLPAQLSPATPFFHAADPEKACAEWETLVGKPGTCKKVGDERINGREAVKYKGVAMNGDTGTAWVDSKLGFVIKWEGERTSCELRNILAAPQRDALFEIPKGYQRMDTAASRRASAKKMFPKAKTAPQKPQN